ncbi:hypothetical protein JCM1840_007183 [Sporobolomyces johnsonii]
MPTEVLQSSTSLSSPPVVTLSRAVGPQLTPTLTPRPVFRHVDPASLLSLASTNKFFHSLLSKRETSRCVWEASFAGAGLPGVSHHGYSFACLFFREGCEECGTKSEGVVGRECYLRHRLAATGPSLTVQTAYHRAELAQEAKLCYEWWQHECLALLRTYWDIVRARMSMSRAECVQLVTSEGNAILTPFVPSASVPPLDRLYADHDWDGRDEIHYFPQLVGALDGDEPLTDAELADIEPLVCEYAARLAEREVQRKNDLRHIDRMCTLYLPYLAMSALRTEHPGVSFAVFASLPVVRLCHSATDIKAAEATVFEEAHRARRCIKLGFARVVVAAYDDALQPLDPDLAHSITPPGYSPLPDTTTWRENIHPGPHGLYAVPFGDVGLDLDDPATIDDAELDRFVNRWTCTFSGLMRGRPDTLLSATSLADQRLAGEFSSASQLWFSQTLFELQLEILDLMHLEDDECTDDRLDHSRMRFACCDCPHAAELHTFTEIVQHLDDSHCGYASSVQLV